MRARIAILGAGNMGGAILKGLLDAGRCQAGDLHLTDLDTARLTQFKKRFHVATGTRNEVAARGAEVIVLCVKPQQMGEVLEEITGAVGPRQTVISVAAGVRTHVIEKALGRVPVVRVMPNTPALIRAGALVYCRGRFATARDERRARTLLSALGPLWKVPERQMDAVTALSGSGPAYVFYLTEILADVGVRLGLPRTMARALARQTVYGAGRMLAETTEAPDVLRRRVTSPGGTTEAALAVLNNGGLGDLFQRALAAATQRSKELSAV